MVDHDNIDAAFKEFLVELHTAKVSPHKETRRKCKNVVPGRSISADTDSSDESSDEVCIDTFLLPGLIHVHHNFFFFFFSGTFG